MLRNDGSNVNRKEREASRAEVRLPEKINPAAAAGESQKEKKRIMKDLFFSKMKQKIVNEIKGNLKNKVDLIEKHGQRGSRLCVR